MEGGIFRDLQAALKTRLDGAEFFSGAGSETAIPVITEDIGDIQNRIDQAIGALGICVILLTVTADATNPNLAGPQWEDIRVVARVKERVVLNRSASGTGQPASLVAEAVANRLHHFIPSGSGNAVIARKISLVPDDSTLTYDVLLEWRGGPAAAPARI